MHTTRRSRRSATLFAAVLGLTWTTAATAGSVVDVNACRTLDVPDTVYRLTANLESCSTCLIVAASRITVDMQGHSITNTGCPGVNAAIEENGSALDVVTVKNGTVQGYNRGVYLNGVTRVSLLGVNVLGNSDWGIKLGPQALVKSCEVANNFFGIDVGSRGQVQQNNVHHNWHGVRCLGSNCLITMNTIAENAYGVIVQEGNRTTVSSNTVKLNTEGGISTYDGSGHHITRNVALQNNSGADYLIDCPSDVSYNESTLGYPASYTFKGAGCRAIGNE